MATESVPAAASAYLAAIGRKGGKTTGPAKARDPAHYRRLADLRRAKAKARKIPTD
jgi:hypothetical protein